MRSTSLLPFALVACAAPLDDVHETIAPGVWHETTNVVVVQQTHAQAPEPDYLSLFRDAGPIADPIADPTPTGITVEEPAPRARVFIGGGGGNVIMNNVTIHGDVYIGSNPVVHAAPSGATIQACETYADRVEKCSARMLGSGEAAQRIIDSMESARRTWRRFADEPRVRASLADSCTVALRQYASASASYCD